MSQQPKMIEFERYADCKNCLLWESAKNPCLPTRGWNNTTINRERALLFVGQSPGYKEDKAGVSFIGYTGQLLDGFIRSSKLTEFVDIYLANACRCKPPQGANESQSQIRACRPYLEEDLTILKQHYKEVIIFNLGAKACYSTLNISSLNEALKKQGTISKLHEDVRVFATFHPAMLHPTRKPGLVRAVETHFSLLIRYLEGKFIPNNIEVIPELEGEIPEKLPAEVTLDIETYGILKGWEQTVFHPVKSKEIDEVDFKHQIVTVGFGWEENGKKLRTPLYIFKFKKHRKIIQEWLRRICTQNVTCIGQNIKFDLLYLKYCKDPVISYWVDPRRLRVDDTLLMSFLLFEQQPEKGLKELSTLFGIVDYSTSEVTGKHGNAKSIYDKRLHHYQSLDNAATFYLYQELKQRIKEKYGENTSKLSKLGAWTRNMIVWDCVDLESNGSSLNIQKLVKFHNREKKKCKELLETTEKDYGIKLAGQGSDAPLRQLMLDAVTEAGLIGDSRVEWSKKTGKISIGVENVNIVRSVIERGRNAEIITNLQEYKERSKIVSTYTRPLLSNKRRGIVTSVGRIGTVYPSWYPVPAYAQRGGKSDDKTGGQIQGRFSCKGPARQTEPRSIRQCSISRWPNGKLVECDMAADHLRMAALLSGDPVLLGAYNDESRNLHTETATLVFPHIKPYEDYSSFEEWKKTKEYKLGKTLNFLIIFRGGAEAFQRTAMQDVGVELEKSFCQKAIDSWFNRHHVFYVWTEEMIRLAGLQGYLEIPTGWSRTFGFGLKNIEGQTGEVLNFLHQCPCAQLTHSAHYKIKHELLNRNLRSVICLNIYDALFLDSPAEEYEEAKEILFRNMNNPPLLPVFEKWTGNKVKWAAELKEYKE